MSEPTHRIAVDPTYGHRRLDPVPGADELGAFYQSRYYHLIRKGGRAPELRRLLAGGPEAERERAWLGHTLYGDVAETLRAAAPGRRVLDVGCGTGDLVAALQEEGFAVEGVEPSDEAAAAGRARGLRIHTADLAGFARGGARFDALVMLNVLEHVPDPAGVLEQAHGLLADGGVLCVRVPNDFSRIQLAAQRLTGAAPWWIAVPDHVSYFDFASLQAILRGHGFEPFESEGDFPMEIFLLLGEDYVGDPKVGSACHRRRVDLEMGLSREDRRALYRALARGGLGRNCLVFARRSAPAPPRADMQRFERRQGPYRYVGLRRAHVQALRVWRNEQMDVLRQKAPLAEGEQERWFSQVVEPAHRSPAPAFLLVSILDGDGRCIGYGGLTHIDWDHRRAEVSFLAASARARDAAVYARDLSAFLAFLERWAFDELGLRRLFAETYAFRTAHVALLEAAGFRLEGRLVAHTRPAGGPVDSLVHGRVREG